jgi:hypothetical protein
MATTSQFAPVPCTCPICGKAARAVAALDPGEGRAPPPPDPAGGLTRDFSTPGPSSPAAVPGGVGSRVPPRFVSSYPLRGSPFGFVRRAIEFRSSRDLRPWNRPRVEEKAVWQFP